MRLLAVSLCSRLSIICLFYAGHRIPEALFFTVWGEEGLALLGEDRHVSWPGSVYARPWTGRRDAGRVEMQVGTHTTGNSQFAVCPNFCRVQIFEFAVC